MKLKMKGIRNTKRKDRIENQMNFKEFKEKLKLKRN